MVLREIRELLRKEIWSKETSRKILIFFAIVGVGIEVFHQVDIRWTTPAERKSARAALMQIDALQGPDLGSGNEFEVTEKKAEGLVQVAENAAITSRDKAVSVTLSSYLELTKIDREDANPSLSVKAALRDTKAGEGILNNAQMAETSKALRILFKGVLHEELKDSVR